MPNYEGSAQVVIPQLDLSAIEGQSTIQDLTFDTSDRIKITENNVGDILRLSTSGSITTNQFIGSQVVINSDRIILNSKDDYLMLFGSKGVSISSKEPVNIDTDSSFTVFADAGVYVGLPNKGADYDFAGQKAPSTKGEPTPNVKYEPMVLGTKLANLLEDLITILQSSIIVTPVGKGKFREDALYELGNLRARLPEILSTYAYLDGVSHESTETPPSPPEQITDPSGVLAVQGNFTVNDTAAQGAASVYTPQVIPSEELKAVPGYYDTFVQVFIDQTGALKPSNELRLPGGKSSFIEEGLITIHTSVKDAFDKFKEQLILSGIPTTDVDSIKYNLSFTSKYAISEEVRQNIANTTKYKPLYLDKSLEAIVAESGSAVQVFTNILDTIKLAATDYCVSLTTNTVDTTIYKSQPTRFKYQYDEGAATSDNIEWFVPKGIHPLFDPRTTGKFIQLEQELPTSVIQWMANPTNNSPFAIYAENKKYIYYTALDQQRWWQPPSSNLIIYNQSNSYSNRRWMLQYGAR